MELLSALAVSELDICGLQLGLVPQHQLITVLSVGPARIAQLLLQLITHFERVLQFLGASLIRGETGDMRFRLSGLHHRRYFPGQLIGGR